MYALPTHEVCQIFMRIFRPRLCWHTVGYFASAPSASSAQSKACSTPGRGRFRPAPISMVADATDGADGVMGSVPTPWLLS